MVIPAEGTPVGEAMASPHAATSAIAGRSRFARAEAAR